MPSIRYMNQSAPFWDFVANFEDQGTRHPFFNSYGNRNADSDIPMEEDAYGWGPMPHRRRSHRHSHPHPPPPPPPPGDGPAPPYTEGAPDPPEEAPEKEGVASPDDDAGEGPSGRRGPPNWSGRRGGWHGRGRGGCGGFGGRHHGRRDPRGGFPFNFGGFGGPMADFFQSQVFGNERADADGARNEQGDFRPAVDVFDTEGAFVVHVSLAGAKKEDVGVSWDADKSELSVAGVIHRPGDEDFLKTLALDERKVGAFRREVRLGTRANPAHVDPDAISAKLEEGVLRVEVPKLDKDDFVEVKKVDIE